MTGRRKGKDATGIMAPPSIPRRMQQLPPPPSSIAVILNLQKAADPTQRLSDRDVFQQLLAEILGPEGGEPGSSVGLEDDLAVNYKLIQVVTSAGLSILLQDDPFASSNELIHQASNSLIVVKLTIQRTPQVLFCPPPVDDSSQTDQSVLYLWLLSRLLPLLGHRAAERLVEELLETLEAVFIAAARIPEARKYLRTLSGYFRSCVNCIVGSFSTIEHIKDAMNKSFMINLPENDFFNDPLVRQIPNLTPQTLQFTIQDPEHAAFVAVYLFSASFGLVSSIHRVPLLRNICDNMSWMLLEMSKLWESLHMWGSLLVFEERVDSIRLKILQTLSKALEQVPSSQYKSKDCEGLCRLAIHCAADTLKEPVKYINQLVEHSLAGIVLGLIYMAEKLLVIEELLQDQIIPLAGNLIQDAGNWGLLHHDLQISILRLLMGLSTVPSIVNAANSILQSITEGKWTTQDSKLQEKLEKLQLINTEPATTQQSSTQASKRIRLTVLSDTLGDRANVVQALASEVYRLLGNQDAHDLTGLSLVASEGFKKLSESDRCTAIKDLGLLSCAFAKSLSRTLFTRDWGPYACSYCDAVCRSPTTTRKYADPDNSELFKTMEVLLKLDSFQESTKVRVWGVMSVKRLLNHTQDLAHLNLAEAGLGKWCVNALQSSRRQLRIAAGQTMPVFVSFSHDELVLKSNRVILIDFLRSLSGGEDLFIQETCVLAWSQLARVSSNEALNLALIQLVGYLGHSTSFIIGIAFSELKALAQHHECTPKKLLSPFWRNISVGVVQQLQSKPQIAQLLSDLLGIDVPGFLRMTKAYTLPYLILWKRTDLVQRVAQVSAENYSTWAVCLDNMAPILALLLTQDSDDVEKSTMALLEAVNPEFKTVGFAELVRPERILIAAELLKLLGDEMEDEEKKIRVYNALNLVAHVSYKLSPNAKLKEKKKVNYMEVFFETNILGIFAQFNDTLKDVWNSSTMEKIRCLRAIGEMVKLAKGCVSNALPQICASLQSALEVEKLRTCALYTWASLMTTLPDEEIGPLLGPTFSVLLQYWEELNDNAQDRAHAMVIQLFTDHLVQIKNWVRTIPSLASVPLLSKFEGEINKWKEKLDIRDRFRQLARRCRHENVSVVEQAFVELRECILLNQGFIHTAAISEQPEPVIPELIRCLLDVIITFKDSKSTSKTKIEQLCAECLGLIGAVDPNRVEAPREKRDMMVLHNFEKADESVEFVVFFLEERIVKAFLSATDTRAQAFLAFGMQEFLKFCDVDSGVVLRQRTDAQGKPIGKQRWSSFSQVARNVLAPFLKSKYTLSSNVTGAQTCTYPVFSPKMSHRQWLQTLLLDLLRKPSGDNAVNIFSICSKIVKDQDISISNFLLPFVTLNVVISGTDKDRENIASELLGVLKHAGEMENSATADTLRQCSETVFLLVDHFTRWLRDKKKYNSNLRALQARQQNRNVPPEDEDEDEDEAVQRVEALLSVIPPDLMGLRSYECNSYSRALFYWEQHIRQTREKTPEKEMEPLYQRLQHIYTQIDEPDGIEGISTKLHVLDIDQQILEHKKAGRWTAAQNWYELLLSEKPGDVEIQTNLLTCLKESGQQEMLLNQVNGMMKKSPTSHSRLLGYAVEAAWISGQWDVLENYLAKSNDSTESIYEIRIGRALSALRNNDLEAFGKVIKSAREDVVNGLTESSTGSLRQCHDSMVKLHSLGELESIIPIMQGAEGIDTTKLKEILDRRLEVMGTYSKDKQYVLALRRAAFELASTDVMKDHIASAWLTSAQLARKTDQIQQSFNAVLHASRLGKQLATVEHAKLLWHEGQHQKAIQNLEGAMASGVLQVNTGAPPHDSGVVGSGVAGSVLVGSGGKRPRNIAMAKAFLLLARWLDGAGQTHSTEIIAKYNNAINCHTSWEQGHYFLGRHYNKLYEAEKALPPTKQSHSFLKGETAKLVCICYIKALSRGTKYIFQTMPRLLTLWLDLGELADQPEAENKIGNDDFRNYILRERKKSLDVIHDTVERYGLPSWMFFTAFPQIMSRIVHPNFEVYRTLQEIVVKVVCAYPQQALWSLMAVCKSTSRERCERGKQIVDQIKVSEHLDSRNNSFNVRALIHQSEKLTEQLLHLCNADLPGKHLSVRLSRDLAFKHNVAPCLLVVPLQSVLTVTLPSTTEGLMKHIPFPSHQPTIAGFLDEADVMTSLQRPRKIKIRGSDGKLYSFLCKPRDDLRKDARLMEFNNMINRFLKKDAESSRRRLYIRTYFVTPLNEECGLIEWVNNVRPLRDIVLKSYKTKRINIDYRELKALLDDACSDCSRLPIFTDMIIPRFPPVFHEWFVEMFSEPSAWFASRLAFSRTCAVMSMVGYVLGLGDRHGENILFDETSGDTLHVDFNCLFDKGQTFDKPEKVPFRLTHNMVDALGVAGYEGVFRRTCEVAVRVLRNNEDTLMTVLETFLHDPAVDMAKRQKRKNLKVPENPKSVLETIQNKLKGLFAGEMVPLSVEGQVQELIRSAVSPENLCAMYIGWCAFF
ncbi:serine/threonine-protein kinase M1 [Rhizina undulata]